MYEIDYTNKFNKKVKLAKSRGKDISKLEKVIQLLVNDIPLADKHHPHLLRGGQYNLCWECHIEPDWLLIYKYIDQSILLMNLGTHSDLFK